MLVTDCMMIQTHLHLRIVSMAHKTSNHLLSESKCSTNGVQVRTLRGKLSPKALAHAHCPCRLLKHK